MRSFSLRLNLDLEMGTYVGVLGWLLNIKNHIKNYMHIHYMLKIDFPFLRFASFFWEGFLHHVLLTTLNSLARLSLCPCEQRGLEFCFSFEYLSG